MEDFICKFCGRVCKNANSLRNHERLCHSNPDRQISYGNKGSMPKHTKSYYITKVRAHNGDLLDITKAELDAYRETHKVCEICGRSIEDVVKTVQTGSPKQLCVDHDHTTKHFRGLLCSVCNRQLGWYENNKDKIKKYLGE